MTCNCFSRIKLNDDGACFSEDRSHRYSLWRKWNERNPLIYLLLNPSIADEDKLDPTLTRCKNYAIKNGYGGIIIFNVFSLISTDPTLLKDLNLSCPKNVANFGHIDGIKNIKNAGIVLGFGNNAQKYHKNYVQNNIYPLLKGLNLKALKITKEGFPYHPLYVGYQCELQEFKI